MKSSVLGRYQRAWPVGFGIPKAERPSARRIRLSKCSRAAVVAGEADSTDNEVVTEGTGAVILVARNMWYVWTEERMKRHERGMTGSPSLLMRF